MTPSGISPDAATNSGGATLTAVDTATGKYELSIPSLGVNYAFQIPMSPFPLGSYLLTPSSGDVVQFSAVGLHYGELGVWAVRSGSTGALKNFAFYTTGFPTTDLPKTGTATYRVVTAGGVVMVPTADGYSSAELWGVGGALTADFAAGAVSGALMFKAWDGNVSTPWNDVSVSATIAEGASRFSGTTAATNAPAAPFALGASATGSVEGNFYGPAAEEVGAIWSLSDGERSAIGLFGGSSVPPSGGGVSQGVGGELISNVP